MPYVNHLGPSMIYILGSVLSLKASFLLALSNYCSFFFVIVLERITFHPYLQVSRFYQFFKDYLK